MAVAGLLDPAPLSLPVASLPACCLTGLPVRYCLAPLVLQKYCSPVQLSSLNVLESRSGFSKYAVNLGSFGARWEGVGGAKLP